MVALCAAVLGDDAEADVWDGFANNIKVEMGRVAAKDVPDAWLEHLPHALVFIQFIGIPKPGESKAEHVMNIYKLKDPAAQPHSNGDDTVVP